MKEISKELLDRYEELKAYLLSLESVAVAFSSGVDSAFLLYASLDAFKDNPEKVIAITATASIFPQREFTEAKQFCEKYGAKHIIKVVHPLEIEGFRENPKNRCYICKKKLFTEILSIANESGIREVVEGSNLDDNGDYRPGMVAIAELDIKSPLRKCGFYKKDIRELSEYFGLPTWNKSSFACLASRFPYGELIIEEKLSMVEEAENILLNMGYKQFRVRIIGNTNYLARIELLPEDIAQFVNSDVKDVFGKQLIDIGFASMEIDPRGYRTGSMNEVLTDEEKKIGFSKEVKD